MPTYSYRCDKCGETVDKMLPISQHTNRIECGGCGGWMGQYIKHMPAIDTYFEGSYKKENPIRGPFPSSF